MDMETVDEASGLASSPSARSDAGCSALKSLGDGVEDAKPERVPVRSFVLKTRVPEDGRWLTLGFVDMRLDQSGGVATLFPEAGGQRQRVVVFPFERRATGAARPQSGAGASLGGGGEQR